MLVKTNSRQPQLITHSVGRLFDGVAALLGLCAENTYEGEAALHLMNHALSKPGTDDTHRAGYPFRITETAPDFFELDWQPAISALVEDIRSCPEHHCHTSELAKRFHQGLARAAAELACTVASRFHCERVLVSGGVWQNAVLCTYTQQALDALQQTRQHRKGTPAIQLCLSRQTPPNDAGLAVGQVVAAGFYRA